MKTQWMKKTLLAMSIQFVTVGMVYANEVDTSVAQDQTVQTPNQETTQATPEVSSPQTASPVLNKEETPSMNTEGSAASALQQKEGDASKEKNLQEVFNSNERQYSLIKKGEISSYYDLDYTYYRDTRLDLGINDGMVNQLRIEEDANHTVTNTFTFQYGVLDNLTFTASVPFVAKSDAVKDTTAAGLGDLSVGARWEPFPLKADRLPLILFGNLSSKTGDSPYEINQTKDLSTGKGYYSVGVGASTRKYIDPVVLFASVSANYGLKETGLNQVRGTNRIIEEFDPGISGGFAFGFAYSFNYDVSLTMSYQQSFNTNAEFTFRNTATKERDSFSPADQSSSTLAFALGVRVSPETIVNGTVGIGLTEDAPDVSLGLSFPLDILGFGKKLRR